MTISSPGPQPRPSARARWKVPVVMLFANAISRGDALRKSANASRALASIASVSMLVAYAQCVLAL